VTRVRVLRWRGIPLQVKARDSDGTHAGALADWFTEHVDRVAMADGLYGTDAYLEQFKWSSWSEREGTAADAVVALIAELEAEWAPIRRRWEASGDLGLRPASEHPEP
jgi:hypothetical protein